MASVPSADVPEQASPDPLDEAQQLVDRLLKEDERLGEDRQLLEKDTELTKLHRQRLKVVLASIPEAQRASARFSAAQLELFCGDLLMSSAGAADKRRRWFWTARAGDALAAVAAAAGGSALIAHLKGTAGTVVGFAILLAGILGALFHAMGGEQEYQRNRGKRRAYDALWWSAWSYAVYQLPTDDAVSTKTALDAFWERWRQIGAN